VGGEPLEAAVGGAAHEGGVVHDRPDRLALGGDRGHVALQQLLGAPVGQPEQPLGGAGEHPVPLRGRVTRQS
jgi:hypothetical protein